MSRGSGGKAKRSPPVLLSLSGGILADPPTIDRLRSEARTYFKKDFLLRGSRIKSYFVGNRLTWQTASPAARVNPVAVAPQVRSEGISARRLEDRNEVKRNEDRRGGAGAERMEGGYPPRTQPLRTSGRILRRREEREPVR